MVTSLPVSKEFAFHSILEISTGPIKHILINKEPIKGNFSMLLLIIGANLLSTATYYIIQIPIVTNQPHIVVLFASGTNGIVPETYRNPRNHLKALQSIHYIHRTR